MKQHDLIPIPARSDARGDLHIIEASQIAGYDFRRIFYFRGSNDPAMTRGGHAHRQCRQFLVCVAGSVTIDLEDTNGKRTHRLDNPGTGLLAQPLTWLNLRDFTPDAVVMVCASHPYDESDYIRDYDTFQKLLSAPDNDAVEYAPMRRMTDADRPAFMAAIAKVLDSGQLIGGPVVKQFEDEFAAWCGTDYAISCGNGLDAIALILEAYGIGPGDEVIVPANSCIATALGVSMVGAKPVLVDCRMDTLGIDASLIESVITPNTRAIIPVHLYGIPADMDALNAIAEKHNLKVIEDSAQGHGAVHKGKRAGNLGHAAAFSFYPTKNLGALGDGGAVTTNDPDIAHKVRMIANYGSSKRYYNDVMGRNSRLDPIQAALLSVKMTHIDTDIERRQKLAALYYDAFKDCPDIQLPQIGPGITAVWHIMPIMVAAQKRDALMQYLDSKGIGTLVHYPVPIHLQKCYAGTFDDARFINAEDSAKRLISLPLTPWHQEDEITRVARTVLEFLEVA